MVWLYTLALDTFSKSRIALVVKPLFCSANRFWCCLWKWAATSCRSSAAVLALSVLGIVTPGSRAVGVLLGNLMGGLLMLALSWSLVLHLRGGPGSSSDLARWALLGAGLWAVQAALGALAGSGSFEVAPVAHLSVALLAVPCALGVGWMARTQGRRAEGVALLCITGLQIVLGASAAYAAAAPALVLLHNIGAAVALALLLGLARGPLES